jgi:hypothetical protein
LWKWLPGGGGPHAKVVRARGTQRKAPRTNLRRRVAARPHPTARNDAGQHAPEAEDDAAETRGRLAICGGNTRHRRSTCACQ